MEVEIITLSKNEAQELADFGRRVVLAFKVIQHEADGGDEAAKEVLRQFRQAINPNPILRRN